MNGIYVLRKVALNMKYPYSCIITIGVLANWTFFVGFTSTLLLHIILGDTIVFNDTDTYELMRCLEELMLSHRKNEYLSYMPRLHRIRTGSSNLNELEMSENEEQLVKETEQQLDVVRLALSRNLARAMLVYYDS
jgi:hypothetical protein